MKTLVLTAGGKKENLVYNLSPHNEDFEKKKNEGRELFQRNQSRTNNGLMHLKILYVTNF